LFNHTKEPNARAPRDQAHRTSRTRTVWLTRFAALVALAAVLPAAGAAATTSSANLVSNSSFETSLSGWGGYEAALQRVSGGVDGAWAASVTATRSASWSIYPSPRQVSSITAGTEYTGSASVKARSGSKTVCLVMREWSGSTVVGTGSSCLTPTSSWASFAPIVYTAKRTGSSLDVYAFGRSGSTGNSFDIDAFSLTTGTATAPAPAPELAVELTSPTAAKVAGTVQVAAVMTKGTAVRIEFLADGALVASDTTAPYSGSWDTRTGPDRTVSLVARAVSSTGATAEAARSFQIDNTAPESAITNAPTGTVTSTSAAIAFTASETATFECSLDGSAWATCTSPRALSGLAVGSHTFRVRAADSLGNVDATPASASWSISAPPPPPPPTGCSVDAATMTAAGCTIVREDSASTADPRAGLWGTIECASTTRHVHATSGGDTARRSNGTNQSDTSYRSLTVISGDSFYGQRCELGRSDWRYGENTGSQTSGSMALYEEGQRKITFFSQRYGAGFNPGVTTWQTVFQQKQTQPYVADGPLVGVALELQIHSNRVHLANFWKTKWSTAAPKLGTWIRYALDVTYSKSSSIGKVQLYVDSNGDGDWSDFGEVSPVIATQTLATAATAGYGLNVGDAIPGHLRMGLYHNPTISCPAPSGCRVDVDNVQIVR
jgi:hypothetical protein